MTLFRFRKSDVPAYILVVAERPRTAHPSKYRQAVTEQARRKIPTPIIQNDIEVEIVYGTRVRRGTRADIDNVIKPTLDALEKVAYKDDSQVRSVTSMLVDTTKGFDSLQKLGVVGLRVEVLRVFLPYLAKEHGVLIAIYSDCRLQELGGENQVSAERERSWQEHLRRVVGKESNGKLNKRVATSL